MRRRPPSRSRRPRSNRRRRRSRTRSSNTIGRRTCSRRARLRASGSTRRTRRCVPRRRSAISRKRPRNRSRPRSVARAKCAATPSSRRRPRASSSSATTTAARSSDPATTKASSSSPTQARLKLQAGVSELDAGRLRVGMPALISVQARPGQTWTGRLVALAPEVDARNRHFQIEVRVQNEKDELLSGMYATASIETGHVASTVLVPREAVTSRDGAWVVYRVVNNVATPVRVTEGLSDGQRIQILAGLSAGDVIVADGRKPIEAGTTVHAGQGRSAGRHNSSHFSSAVRRASPCGFRIPRSNGRSSPRCSS